MMTECSPVQRTAQFDWERSEALAGIAEQISAVMDQVPSGDPAALERLEVCLSLLRHLAFPSTSADVT